MRLWTRKILYFHEGRVSRLVTGRESAVHLWPRPLMRGRPWRRRRWRLGAVCCPPHITNHSHPSNITSFPTWTSPPLKTTWWLLYSSTMAHRRQPPKSSPPPPQSTSPSMITLSPMTTSALGDQWLLSSIREMARVPTRLEQLMKHSCKIMALL